MRIGHIHIKVRNLVRAEQFYRELLGAHVTERLGNQFSFLSMGTAHHEIALQAIGDDGNAPTADMVGLYHSAFEVAGPEELLAAILRLETLGAPFSLVDHGISWAVYSADPDGNGVEIYLDRRGAAGGKSVWAGSSWKLRREEIDAARGMYFRGEK